MRPRHSGFSLIELMIAVLLAAITGAVVLQVMSSFAARKNTTVGRDDAQINAALGLYAIESEVRMAGAGLTTPTGMLCAAGINVYFNGTVISDGAPFAPLRIVDGGAGPDTLEIMRTDSQFGSAPTRLVQAMASTTAALGVDGSAGLVNGDLMMIGAGDGSKLCTLMRLSAAPIPNGSGWILNHDSTSNYNPVNPAAVFANPVQYDVRDIVVNAGRYGIRSFRVICNDGNAPSATNSCDLSYYNRVTAPNPPAITDGESIAPQVVDFQAQYGVAPAGSQTVDQWVDATGGTWAAPTSIDQRRIKAVRLAIVTRSNREGTAVSPASVVLWDAGLASERTRAFSAAEQRFRYQVLTVVIPLINVIWAGV